MVNTFLVCENFDESARQLDNRRLGKQRVEAFQILNVLKTLELMSTLTGIDTIPSPNTDPSKALRRAFVVALRKEFMKRHPERKRPPGWWSHPAVMMWIGHRRALELYLAAHIREWIRRGYKNTMIIPDDPCSAEKSSIKFPEWVKNPKLHKSHRQSLFKKAPEEYPAFEHEGVFTDYLWP